MSIEERIKRNVQQAEKSYEYYLDRISAGEINIKSTKVRRELDYREIKRDILRQLADDLELET